MFYAAFADIHGETVRTIDLGDGWVLGEVIWAGVHNGPYFGIPPTGLDVSIRGGLLLHFDPNGLLVYGANYWNNLDTLREMGVVPETVGTFDSHMDIGKITPGEAIYNSDSGDYQVKGSAMPVQLKQREITSILFIQS